MKTTLSIIRADVGSVGGHVLPSQPLINTIREHIAGKVGKLISDYLISSTGRFQVHPAT